VEVPFQFTQDLGLWAYLLLALLVMVEGPVATLAGAVAASAGLMKPFWVFVSAASGNLVSDILWYTLGYLGKMEWLHRYGSYFGLRAETVARFNNDIQKHVGKLLFIAKLTLGFTIPTLVATGLARIPLRRWFLVLALGETIWTGSLVILGVNFGHYVQRLERGVEVVALAGALLFVVFLIFYISRVRRRSSDKTGEKEP
jgi:membrane protein DedA with SNARE-associated domain